LGGKEKFFAATSGTGVELQDAGDKFVGFGGEIGGGNNLRDQANFQGFLWSERLAEEDEREGEARESVFAEIGHDGGGGQAVGHFGEAEGGGVGDEREVGDDGEAHAETEGVALHFGDGNLGRGADETFEIDETGDFGADGLFVAGGTFAAGAENFSVGADAQDACAGLRRFGAEFGEHGVEHGAGDFVAVVGIVEGEGEDVGRALDFDQGRKVGHGREIIQETRKRTDLNTEGTEESQSSLRRADGMLKVMVEVELHVAEGGGGVLQPA